MRAAIERDSASNHIRIGGETFFPAIVTDNDLQASRSTAGLFIISDKGAPHLGLDAEHVEKFRAGLYAADARRALLARQGKDGIAKSGDAGKGAVLLSQIEEVRVRKSIKIGLSFLARVGHADGDELLRLRERQRFQ